MKRSEASASVYSNLALGGLCRGNDGEHHRQLELNQPHSRGHAGNGVISGQFLSTEAVGA